MDLVVNKSFKKKSSKQKSNIIKVSVTKKFKRNMHNIKSTNIIDLGVVC